MYIHVCNMHIYIYIWVCVCGYVCVCVTPLIYICICSVHTYLHIYQKLRWFQQSGSEKVSSLLVFRIDHLVAQMILFRYSQKVWWYKSIVCLIPLYRSFIRLKNRSIGWLELVDPLKLYVSFAKEPIKKSICCKRDL